MFINYPVTLEREDGAVLARITHPEGVFCGFTDGADEKDALIQAADMLEEMIAACIVNNEDIPLPESCDAGTHSVSPGALAGLKAELYTAFRREGLRKTDFAERIGGDSKTVARLLDIRHNSPVGQMEKAFAALGQRLVIDVRPEA